MTGTFTTIYLYVNLFDATELDWVEQGNSPYLDTINLANRIEALAANLFESWFGFEDLPEGIVYQIWLSVYCKIDAPSNDQYLRFFIDDGVAISQTTRQITNEAYTWVHSNMVSILTTRAKVNACKVRIKKEVIGGPAVNLRIACARLWVRYYDAAIETTKSPTSNVAQGVGWINPDNAHADGGGEASALAEGRIQRYKEHGFANVGLIYEVHVMCDARRSAVGVPDIIKVGISWDGGASWHDTVRPLTAVETTYDINKTAVTNWIPDKLSDANLLTRLWSGSSGCHLGPCELGLWVEDEALRKQKKAANIDLARFDNLHFFAMNVEVEDLPRLLGWTWKDGFKPLIFKGVVKHENRPCYHIQLEEISSKPKEKLSVKDVESSASDIVWECFKGHTRVADLELGDVMCGLDWNAKLKDYRLMPMRIIAKKFIGYHDVYEVITDSEGEEKVHMFVHSTMAVIVKW